MNCPSCQIKVPRDAINIQKDIAGCQSCGNIFSISDQVNPQKEETNLYTKSVKESFDKKSQASFDMNNPPKGAYINHLPNGVQIGASTRSWMALFIVPFAIVWSAGSIGGIYGSQVFTGEFDILISLFGIPFLFGSIFVWSLALMAVAGKIEVNLDSNGGHIFTGVGKIGQNKRFLWSEINSVRQQTSTSRSSKGGSTTSHHILLEGQRQVQFGSGLSSENRYYMIKTLEQLIENRKLKQYHIS